MEIGIFSTHALWPVHIETELEIAQKLLDNGQKLHYFTCNRFFQCCDQVLENAIFMKVDKKEVTDQICSTCISKRKKGKELLVGNVFEHPIIDATFIPDDFQLDELYFKNHSSFKNIYIDNFDVGWAILSSIISFTRDPFVDISIYKNYINQQYVDCYNTYFNTINNIKFYNLDEGYVFNGRLSVTKAILRAFERLGKTCYTHERGSSLSKYSLFENTTIHDIRNTTNSINSSWQLEEDEDKKKTIGSQFFIDRRNGIVGSWKSFIDMQSETLLPSNWEADNHNIVLFTSSEDEFVSIGPQWDNEIYNFQIEGIKKIADSLKFINASNLTLYIRIHPNSALMSPNYIAKIADIQSENITVVMPDSPVSTYALLDNANTVVTFGSTVGIEAVFWGKPSILLGKSLYCELEGVYKPSSHEDAIKLMLDRSLQSLDCEGALRYGYYFQTYGIDYNYYAPQDYMSGRFKGVDLNKLSQIQKGNQKPSFATRIFNKFKKYGFLWSQ